MTISEEIINNYQRAWHYLGLWSLPSQPRHRWYTVYSYIVHFTALIVFNVGLVLSLFVASSLDDIIETLLPACSTVTAAVKVLLLKTSRRDFNQLKYLMKLLETVISFRERSFLLSTKRKSTLVTSSILYSSMLVVALLILNATVIQPKRALLWSSLYPFDWQSNTVWYVVAMIFQVVCSVYIGMTIISLDMWRVAAFYILAGFLDVLSARMQRLGWLNLNTANRDKSQLVTVESKPHRYHEEELLNCVKYYLLCLRYNSYIKSKGEMLINII